MDHTVQPRRHRIACAVYFFISGFGYSAWASRIPSVQHQLHLSEAGLGAILFALPIGLMLTLPFTNYLLSRYSSRAIVLIGALSFNVVLCLAGIATAAWQLAIILFLFGSSRNIFNLSVNAHSVDVQSLYKRSIITTFHGLWSMAGFAGAALGYVMVSFNVGTAWHLPGVGISMVLVALWFYKNAYHKPPAHHIVKKPIFSLPDKHLLKFAIITFASMAVENTMYDWSGIYFLRALNSTARMATAAFVFYMVSMTLARLVGDKLVDRLGVKQILNFSGALITTGLLIAVFSPLQAVAVIGYIFTGAGVSCVVPLVFSLAGKSKSMSSASAIASVSTIGYLGFLLVPPLIGFVAQAVGIRIAFGIIAALGAVILWMVSKIEGEE